MLKISYESGQLLPLTAGFIIIAVLLLAIVVDFGRYTVEKEKLQTASDAASLAAAKNVERWVELEVVVGMKKVETELSYMCIYCRDEYGNIIISRTAIGLEDDLLPYGYRSYCCSECDENICYPILKRRWVNYTDSGHDAIVAANSLFGMNVPAEMTAANGGSASMSVDTRYLSQSYRSSAYYPSVFINAQGKIKTLMIDIFSSFSPGLDASEMDMSTCSQGRSYYRDASNSKWSVPPSNQCPN